MNIAAALFLISCAVAASSAQVPDITSVGTDGRWRVAGRTASIVEAKGKRALKLSEGPGMGIVWLDGYQFGNGTIDIDILGRSQPIQGSFVGVAFRVVDERSQEAVYFRPFNFGSDDPARRAHSVQYVSHPEWPWERLRSQHPGEYENAVVPAPDGDEWFHARVVVAQPQISVYVNGAAKPCLVVKGLSDRPGGSVGVWVGEGSGGYFANLKVTPAH